jgi:membrane fusion protein, multidrug efflux system
MPDRNDYVTGNRNLTSIKDHTRPIIPPDHQLPPPPAHSRHRMVTLLLSLAILVVFVVAFVWVLRKHDETNAANSRKLAAGQAVTVTIATAKTGNIGLYLDSIGTVTPVYTDSIMSQVNGLVIAVHFNEGQLVKQGDPLIDIDPRPYAATLLQAQGALERDQNLLAQAQMDLERYRAAWARNAIPKQTLDDQEKIVLQDEGTVKNDEGTVQYDQVQLDFCHITSPITGRVGLRLVDPGNVVQSSSNTVLAVVTQISPITVVFPIAEDSLDLLQSHLQDGTKLEADAYDRAEVKKLASGSLITIDNQIDTTTGTVKGRALFPNRKMALFPNQFVNVRLLVTTLKGVTLIPDSAIQHNGDQAFVYVINDNTAQMVNVTTGVTDNGLTQVKGVTPGQVLANSGFERLEDKAKVSPSTRPTSGPSESESEAP